MKDRLSTKSTTARFEAKQLPCVVIDQDEQGNHYVYADPGVVVFERTAHIPDDLLYRYSPPAIPAGWLDHPAGFLGDGSAAEERALAFVEVMKEVESKRTGEG